MTHRRFFRFCGVVAIAAGVLGFTASRWTGASAGPLEAQVAQTQSATPAGQSATRLPDGRWLLVGGEDAPTTAVLWDASTRTATRTGPLQAPRAWHSATLLADGTVLLLGGRNEGALVETPEIFDPGTGRFTWMPIAGATPRASHTATLLTDGRVLVAGGSAGGPIALPTELWDTDARTVTPVGSEGLARSGHTATLLADGRVLAAGGNGPDGMPAERGVAIDPLSGAVQQAEIPSSEGASPVVAFATPGPGTSGVAPDARLAVRFSHALTPESLTSATLSLQGVDGPVETRVIAAEGGRLAFVWPADRLAEGASYVLNVSGAVDVLSVPVASTSIPFVTRAQPADLSDASDPEAWIPDPRNPDERWRTNRPRSSWESLAPLVAPPGVTAISGRVLTLDGRPLPGVTLEMDGARETETDRTGRFLLLAPSVGAGRHVLEIEGETANRPNRTYGFFEYGLTVVPGQTTVLPFTIWMPKLDTRHVVRIPSPTTSEVVVTTPYVPGLELHLPPNTIIRGEDGKPVTEVGITPVPVDRPPFPLAKNVDVPVYFTVQPGGAYVYTANAPDAASSSSRTRAGGAWLVYPNYWQAREPGQRVQFFHYDPEVKDWYVYGPGRVNPDGAQVTPDPTTRFYAFTGAMFGGSSPPDNGPNGFGPGRGEPIDPATGVFTFQKTDLYLPGVLPLALTRTYNSGDTVARPFGRGMIHPYAMYLWSAQQYQEVDLFLPDGTKVHYVRTSAGTGWIDAVFEHTTTPSRFYKSVITWRPEADGWNLTLKDGTVYVFGENAPLQAITDRYGNTITITHANGQTGNITRVTAPNGRFLAFTYDGSNRITQVTDILGRAVSYTYDANGNLSTVTDPENGVTTYTWNASNRIATITDGRQITYLTNTYTNGRVTSQTLANANATYQFSYTVDGSGNVTQTDVTDPNGHVERLAFNSSHYVTSDTEAYGTSLARTTTIERQSGSNLVTATVDGLNRRTEYTYDSNGHMLTATRLAGTGDAVTTTYTYEPLFGQLATVTDPLNHTSTVAYDTTGKPTSVSDPLSHQSTITMNPAGQVTSVTDPLNHSWQFGYTDGDLTSVTDPLSAMRSRFVDAGGRTLSAIDPLGRVTRTVLDKLNRVTSVIDAQGGQTSFTYDANTNLLSVTDALNHTTSFTYDDGDRLATRTDPLSQSSTFHYDLKGNLTQTTDRKSQVTGTQYDALDRLSEVTFHDSSTIAYTYDAGDRVTQIADSANGTITREYDGRDRLTQETTPQGTVSYSYDADGRRTTMTVAGQTTVEYEYDNAHRLTLITEGSTTVALTQDNADRPSTFTYPNGIVATYGYNNANRLTSVTYTLGSNTLGDVTYAYDGAGNRTAVGGSWARTGLPAALASVTYDAANRITAWAGTSFSHDANGNLTNDGTSTYTWNARNQLTGLSGGASASFAYDSLGRRRGKTVSAMTTAFLYDGFNLVQELSSAGTPIANLVIGLGIDKTFARTDGDGTKSLLTDGLGSTLALANAAGTVQTAYTYEPFGATSVSGTTSTNAQQFTGRENDGTGLYYYRARFYSPARQRFIADDPIGFVGGVNLYEYTRNNPTNLIDPSGEVPFLPPSWCQPPPPGRKDPWPPLLGPIIRFLCAQVPPTLPLPLPDVPIPPLFPWPSDPKPPQGGPTPPGYDPTNPGWRYGYPEGPTIQSPRYFDPKGGEWRFHPPDRWHPAPHWDYNPWDQWNSPWQNVPISKNEPSRDFIDTAQWLDNHRHRVDAFLGRTA
jgi:RHS repeat-associated protein